MQKVYATVGDSFQSVGEQLPGQIEMASQRPECDYVATETGEWVPAPTPVPQTVTPAQGLMALYILHEIKESDIHTAIAGIEDATMRYQATIAFTRATMWERQSEALGLVAGLMSLTEADLDAAFTLGATFTGI